MKHLKKPIKALIMEAYFLGQQSEATRKATRYEREAAGIDIDDVAQLDFEVKLDSLMQAVDGMDFE